MATDLSARICTNCRHASLCPLRDEFMAFYEHRNEVMVKCGNDDGTVDTSQEVTVRIEHRYLDGPGLEDMYKLLNLKGPGWWPCAAPYTNCPYMKHPFDTPIFAPYPKEAGYIEPLCRGARDAEGNRLPFIAPIAPPRTNEYHVSPYPTYPMTAWNCDHCSNRTQCQPTDDYAKLGGTVYSTFAITYQDGDVGTGIALKDIAVPGTILSGYERAIDKNPESFTITGEDDVFIIYYTYVGEGDQPLPSYPNLEDLEKEGKTHTMKFFYAGKSYVYPSQSSEPSPIAMTVKMNGLWANSSGLIVEDKVIAPNCYIQLVQNGTGKLEAKYDASQTVEPDNLKDLQVDVSMAQYQELSGLVEGEKIQLVLTFDKRWKIATDLMKTMNYGMDILDISVSEALWSNSNMVEATITVVVPAGDFFLQTIFVERSKWLNSSQMPAIDYLTHWSPKEIRWGYRQTAVTIGSDIVMVDQPIPPRYWDRYLVTDSMPYYAPNYPPNDKCIVRPYFNLLGYTDNQEQRYSFDEELKFFPADEMDYLILATNDALEIKESGADTMVVHKTNAGATIARRNKTPSQKFIRFIKNSSMDQYVEGESFIDTVTEPDFIGGFAMWKLDANAIEEKVMAGLQAIDAHISSYELADGDFQVIPADMLENWEEGGIDEPYMVEVYPATQLQWPMEYMPNLDVRLYQTLQYLVPPDNFNWKLFRLPSNIKELTVWNTWPENETILEHDPHGLVTLKDGTATQLSEWLVSDTHKFADELSCQFLLIVQPNKLAGMHKDYQNYKMYQIRVTQTRKDINVMLYFDGKDMSPFGGVPNPKNLKSYRLLGVYPEDINKLTLEFKKTESGTLMELGGEAAPFYKLSNRAEMAYVQTVTVHSSYNDKCYEEEQTYQVNYRGIYSFDFKAPDGDSIVEITLEGARLFAIVDSERLMTPIDLEDGTQAYITLSEDEKTFTVHLANIGKDLTLEVTYHQGDDGSIEGCSRCKGYVDTSTRDWLEWMPICHNFEN